MITLTAIKKNAVTLGISLLLMGLGQGNAHALTLPDVPLSSFSNVEHNVLLTFDDSGSMARSYVPDTISAISNTRRGCSSQVNGVYYNPSTAYSPPVNADGSLRNPTPTSFGAAYRDGYNTGSGTVNLATSYQPSWANLTSYVSCGFTAATTTSSTTGAYTTARNAFYFTYNGSACGPDTSNACFTLVQHNNAAAGGDWSAAQQQNFANWYSYYRNRNLTAKTAAGLAFQGFGTNVRIAGKHLNNAAAGAGATIRFTNTTSTNTTNVLKRFCDDPTNSDSLCIDGSTARTDFYTRLYNSPASGMTPLQAAMRGAGLSFGSTNTGTYSPYRDVPGVAPTVANPNLELSCRKNFHIMMTDGYWNSTTAADNVGSIDGVGQTLGDGITAYAPQPPYSDAWTSTLADHAFYYWSRDLRPDLTNNVKAYEADATGTASQRYWNPVNNPATWQHLQNFTIGLGITGTRNPANYFNTALPASAGDWDDLLSGVGANGTWPNPTDAENGDRIDDLWHAAINSRGTYFSAGNPAALANAFNQIVGQINQSAGSAAGLGASGGSAAGGTSIFQVLYETSTWTGRLISRQVDANGIPTSVAWEAGTAGLNTQNYSSGRNIFTYNPSTGLGVPFTWGDLSAAQQTALNLNPSNVPDGNGQARLDYLRGASTNEGPGNPINASSLGFRARTCYNPATVTSTTPAAIACSADVGKLGDIIHSSPVYVRKPVSEYPDNLESVKYSIFAAAQASRPGMVYVGANDGMLHGFQESDGKETMAYVPNMVYANAVSPNNLSLLTSPTYSHRYYVDGTPTVGDVFINSAWHTMLVGGLRKGGKGYYALDITNPNNFTQSTGNAQQLVKWEFTDANDADLGYSYSQATIVKMANGPGGKGRWAAVFGNGYNNTGTGRAMLFIVDIETGVLIKKIDTGVCASAPCGGGTVANPNGLGAVTVVDLDDDYIADYIYAGDLLGRLWRFDVRNETPANWSLAANVTSVFTAVDPLGVVQPITTQPSVGFHPLGFGGLMIYFGTGKYLETTDNTTGGTQQTQSFYGIYDRGVAGRKATPSQAAPVARADLLQQTIDATIGTVTRPAGPEGAAVTFDTRNISNNPITYRLNRVAAPGTYLGWYVNLPTPGERQVTASLVREGRIIFTTLIPSSDACNPGGTGWLMELNAENGGRLTETLDLNGNGTFTSADNSGLSYGAAGAKVSGGDGSFSTPVVLTIPGTTPPPGGSCTERKLSQATSGVILSLKEKCKPQGRASWRQIR